MSRKSSNYYRVVFESLMEGGQWKAFLGVTVALHLLLGVVFAIIFWIVTGPFHPRSILVGLLVGAILAVGLPVVFFFADVLLFGIPCIILRVRLDPRRHSVLDLFAFCYLIALVPKLVTLITDLVNPQAGLLLALLYPFFHAGVLGYFMVATWDFTVERALILAGIRFGYQVLVVVGYVVLMLML